MLSGEQASVRLACILVKDSYTLGCWFFLSEENSRLCGLPYFKKPCYAINIIEEDRKEWACASGKPNEDTTKHIRKLYDNYMESSHTEAGNKLR